jgi:Tol biopolymer transport system component
MQTSNHSLKIIVILVTLLLVFTRSEAQTSGTAQQLRDLLTHPNCSRTCYMGIQPGRTTQAEVRNYFTSQNIVYRVYAGFTGNDEANGFYFWTLPSNTPFADPAPMSSHIGFENGVVSRIGLGLFIPYGTAYEAFGYPQVTLASGSDPNFYYLMYNSSGLIFQVAKAYSGLNQTNLVSLATPEVLNFNYFAPGDFPVTSSTCGQVPQEICAIPQDMPGTGLRGQYFDNTDFTALKRYQIDSTVNIVPPNTTLPVVIPLSIRWVGRVEPLYSEAYTFYVNSSRRERLWVNGQLVLSDWSNPAGESSGTITLAAGVRYDVLLEYADEFGPNAQIKLEWQSARQARQIIPASQLYPPEGQMAFNGRTGSTGEIFVRNPDGTGEINVSNHAADDNSPAWSPDGTRLAFVSTRSGNQDIWLVNADGSGLRQLTNHSSFDREIAWSSDGTKIAFSSGRTGGGDIYVISVAGTGIPSATRFTSSTLNEYNPVWAPNGGGIAYVVDTGTSTGADLYWRLATAAGAPVGNPIRLTNRNGTDTAPFFSPDGSKIVFRAPVSGVDQIWVVDLGRGISIIGPLTTQGNNYFQSWSPDSTRILFQSTRDGNPEIYSMNADGSSQTRLTNNSVSEAYAVWSADARQIAFQRGNDLWLMNADGSNQRNVSNTPNRTELEIVWWQVKQS